MTPAKRILVVDDDIDAVEMMETMLRSYNYEVLAAHDGAHALEKTNKHHIDLILLDYRMPLFSGIWYCDALKRKPNTRNIPIVIVSGGIDDEMLKKAREVGAVDYLKKPFTIDDLLRVVNKHIL